jgi:pimeloyl-ACP methyl ester carboxylesterase
MTQRLRRSAVSRLFAWAVLAGALAVGLPSAEAWQNPTKTQRPANKEKEPKLPPPVEEKIELKSGASRLIMKATYYPSLKGKEAVPVLLLHGYEGTRADYAYLAEYLHRQGHAVLVPDLRGHGDSTEVHLASGDRMELSPKKMAARDFNAMVADLDAVKSWFLQRNNDEELNMEALVVVGADMTTVTAMNFALRDWQAPELLNYKNCKDVKAIVLLSPEQNYRGTSMKVALKHPVVGHQLSVMVAVGKKDSGAMGEAKRIVNTLERQHGETNDEKRPEEKEIVLYAADTNLQGTKLLDRNLGVVPIIAKFIEFRVQSRIDDFPYTARIRP